MNFLRYKQIKILCVLVLCLVVVLSFVIFHRHNFSLEESGQGRMSGLRFLWLQTLYDPILALPGIEPDSLKEVVSSLKEAEEVTMSQYTKEEQKRLKEVLHPYDFLETLPKLEAKRRTFIEEPSYWNAFWYHITLIKSLAYLEDYTSLLSDTIYELDINQNLSAPRGDTSHTYVASVAADAYVASGSKKEEVWRRARCLIHGVSKSDCEISYPEINETNFSSEEITDDVLKYAEALRSFFFYMPWSRVYSVTDTPVQSLPLVRLKNAACTTHDSPTYIFFWRDSRISGLPTLYTTPVDDIYFHQLDKGKTLFEEALLETGVEYTYQPMNPYLCFDYSLDAGKVRTAFAIYNELIASPIFSVSSKENRGPALQELSAYEQEIISSKDIIDTGVIDIYMRKVAKFLYDDSRETDLEESDQRRLLPLLTLWRSKSAWLETEIATMEDITVTSRTVFKYMDIPIPSLILTRSYYSTLLLAGNMTLYSEELRFIENTNNSGQLHSNLVRYQGGLEREIPPDKLAEFLFDEVEKSHSVYSLE